MSMQSQWPVICTIVRGGGLAAIVYVLMLKEFPTTMKEYIDTLHVGIAFFIGSFFAINMVWWQGVLLIVSFDLVPLVLMYIGFSLKKAMNKKR